jgi:carboxymethylenebutenolidase
MPLLTETVFAPTSTGPMETYVARPDGEGPYPAVILFHNIRGITDDLRWCARRIAQAGYVCAAPSLYHRVGERIVTFTDTDYPEAVALKRIAYEEAFKPFHASEDVRGLVEYLRADLTVSSGPMGVVGHCMGGYFAPQVAGLFPDDFAAMISVNPVRLMEDREDSPQKYIDRLRGEAYFGFAELDGNTPPDFVEAWSELMERSCTAKFTVETHAGQKHGFAVPGRVGVWNKAGAERVFDICFDIFARQLH